MGKSFSSNPAMGFLTQKPKNTQDTQEVHKNTQGRKGHALPRINMAFQEDLHQYLQIISRVKGKTITAYVNDLIRADMEINQDKIEQMKELLK